MAMVGYLGLLVAFAVTVISVVTLLAGGLLRSRDQEKASLSAWIGRLCVAVGFVALTLCCAVLVYCFMTGDVTIRYVVEERSNSASDIAWLYRLSGLWAGRQGSLLFWAWLISAFDTYVVFKTRGTESSLDDIALGVGQLVLVAFLGVLQFSSSNMPFTPMDESFFDANGNLVGASMFGMNRLLEHCAMCIHPPTLFIGYAGMTVPFSYAVAALVTRDDSVAWVKRVNNIASFSWLFLGIGIGLGSVWAYVVLGWGGYWGWDPVENASLLSWLACTALIHSFTMYRLNGSFKRWSVVCACFAFMFVILGTFISRSGLVQSVHAFAGDNVSLVLFLVLIGVSFAAALIGMFHPAFKSNNSSNEPSGVVSREMGYFLNNVILMASAFLLAYLTILPALPSWLPLGGQSFGAQTFNAIARPVGIVLLLCVAIGPMLGWRKTDPRVFARKARIPGICALILFVALMVYFATVLLPVYTASVNAGDTAAAELSAYGPSWYYNGLAVVGFAVASLLVFNGLFMCIRAFAGKREDKIAASSTRTLAQIGKAARKNGKVNSPATSLTGFARFRAAASSVGGMFSHAALGIILIGLIGSSMYVSEHTGYVASTSSNSKAAESFDVGSYTLIPTDSRGREEGDDVRYYLDLDVYDNETKFAHVQPSILYDPMTQQQKLDAQVISKPQHDLFIVYRGVNDNDDYSLDVRINPLISFVWVGFVLLMLGTACTLFSSRPARKENQTTRVDGNPHEAQDVTENDDHCDTLNDNRDEAVRE